jgi:hypothetical protein
MKKGLHFGHLKNDQQPTQLSRLVGLIEQTVNSNQPTIANSQSALSLESLRDDQYTSLEVATTSLSMSLEAIAAELGFSDKLTDAQIKAGTVAGIYAGDWKGFLSHKTSFPIVATENMAVVQSFGVEDAMDQRSFGLEAYDERENRNAVIYSIAYNMQSARQDEFGETFYPTIALTSDNVGFGITVDLMMVYDGIERKISGDFEDFKKKNIIRAVADYTILRKELTKVVPVNRLQSVANFVDPLLVPAYDIMLEDQSIHTAPLAFGKKIDLIGIGHTDALLSAGIMDQTDTLDPAITMKNIYVNVGGDVLKIAIDGLPLANLVYSVQNNYRTMNLNFHTTSVLINKDTKRADGSNLVALAGIVANDLIVRIEIVLSGSVNIETGETNMFGNAFAAYTVQDASGNLLDLTTAPAAALVDALNAGDLFGYDILAFRTNANRRQRGQLIDVTKFTQLYNVPLRSPISTVHPVNSDGQSDASDVQALITTTRIRTSNEAVTALLGAAQILRTYVDARDTVGVGPDLLGVGRFYVKPAYFEETLDMNVMVDSIKSHERAADIQAALVNKIRDVAYRLYRDSEFKAAADAFAGGISNVPVCIIGTDPVIHRYLTVSGDLRTLSGGFDVRIVSSLDRRMAGKIVVAFGVFDETRNVSPNPLNFGNLVWSPELVLSANISRGGSFSKETIVQPRFLFVTHSPIMAVLSVENVPDTLNKIPLLMHSV